MSSLTEQMEQLKRQQEVLALKIKEDDERIRKESLTIEKLELFNKNSEIRRKQLFILRKKHHLDRSELTMIYHTKPRFEVILEILKKQDTRIQELEEMLLKK
jgi:hypothetical protein